MENLERKSSVVLGTDDFAVVMASGLEKFVDYENYYYSIAVMENSINIGKQGFNTPMLGTVSFDMSGLDESERCVAVKTACMHTYANANTENIGCDSHVFYKDYTGKYPVDAIITMIPEENCGMHR